MYLFNCFCSSYEIYYFTVSCLRVYTVLETNGKVIGRKRIITSSPLKPVELLHLSAAVIEIVSSLSLRTKATNVSRRPEKTPECTAD